MASLRRDLCIRGYRMADDHQKNVLLVTAPEGKKEQREHIVYFVFEEDADDYEKKNGVLLPFRLLSEKDEAARVQRLSEKEGTS